MKRIFMLALSGTIVTFAAGTPVTFKDTNLAAVAAQSLPAGQPAGPVTDEQAPSVVLIRSDDTISGGRASGFEQASLDGAVPWCFVAR